MKNKPTAEMTGTCWSSLSTFILEVSI